MRRAIAAFELAAGLLLTIARVACATEVTVWSDHPKPYLDRILTLPHLAVAIVTYTAPDAFQVVEVLHGDMEEGERLLFKDCAQIMIPEPAEATLRRLVEQAPVLDEPLRESDSIALPGDRKPDSYLPPKSNARYLLFFRIPPDWDFWGLAYQTLNDFYLLGEARVFRRSYIDQRSITGSIWIRVHPEMTSQAFLGHVRARLAAERAEPGAAAKPAAP